MSLCAASLIPGDDMNTHQHLESIKRIGGGRQGGSGVQAIYFFRHVRRSRYRPIIAQGTIYTETTRSRLRATATVLTTPKSNTEQTRGDAMSRDVRGRKRRGQDDNPRMHAARCRTATPIADARGTIEVDHFFSNVPHFRSSTPLQLETRFFPKITWI